MAINRDNDQEGFGWHSMLVLSLLLHGLLFSALFWVPGSSSGSLNEVVYEVTLVDMSKGNLPKGVKSAPAAQKPSAQAAATDDRQARRISPSSSQKNKVIVAKRTVERSKSKPRNDQASSNKLLDRAISKIEKKVKTENNDDYIDKAIAALDKKVGAPGGKTGSGASEGGLAMNMYKMEVETQIKSNWTCTETQQNLEAIVLVKIRRDGMVLDISFIKPSRNKNFDDSVLKAIEKAKPLPPLPEGYDKDYEEIEINFNLRDLE